MPTLIIKTNASQATDVLVKDMGILIPNSGGSETFTDIENLDDARLSQNLRTLCTDDAFEVGSSTLILNDGTQDIAQANVDSFLADVSGIKGETGSVGYTGTGGTTGLYGITGLQGPTGTIGLTGSQGYTGFIGFTGSQGITGVTGETGLVGTTGHQGYTGVRGLTGVIGATGSVGETGTQGFTGTVGNTGIQGQTGSQGLTGLQGVTGSGGITGLSYLATISKDFETGLLSLPAQNGMRLDNTDPSLAEEIVVDGLDGTGGVIDSERFFASVGAYDLLRLQNFASDFNYYLVIQVNKNEGPDPNYSVQVQHTVIYPGYATSNLGYASGDAPALTHIAAMGVTGLGGATGSMGVTGLKGLTGLVGSTGSQGLTGVNGVTGTVGLTGIQGYTGSQGLIGIDGVTGLTGFTGSQGETGSQGFTGLANFLDRPDFPSIGVPPVLLWNEQDEALYVGVTGVGNWVQISAGSMQGATGLNSLNFKSFTMESPTSSENATLFYTDTAITITGVRGILYNGSGTPSITIDILHDANRSNAGTSIFAAPRNITSVTTGDSLTLGGTVSIPANRFVWFVVSGSSGTVPELNVTMFYTV